MKDKSLGPYTLLKRIAVGGTAEIYLARKSGQLGGFEKYYALKVMLPQRRNDEDAEKVFVDEARLTSQLQHDNIVGVLDLDQDDGRVYMVMEYVRGQDLSMVLDALRRHNGLLAIEVAAFLAREACAGLQYAHTRKASDGQPLGLVHRDISPQNILVGVEGDVKIIDFGVAKMRGRGRIETKTGIIKGKLRYMAPEYAIGNQQDARGDIFAVGLCLFELMTGRPAYDDADSEAIDLVERIKTADIPTPSSLREDVPPELDAICRKALAAHPDDRYQTALAMQKELSVYLANAAPDFTKAHLSTYVSRLFERLEILPEVTSEVNADGIDARELRASREKRESEAPTEAFVHRNRDSAEPGPIPKNGELQPEPSREQQGTELEPTDVSIRVKDIRRDEDPWNTPTGELQLENGAPELADGPSKQREATDKELLEKAELVTQSGFQRLLKRKPDEDSTARIEFGEDRVKTMDLKIPSPGGLRKKSESMDTPRDAAPSKAHAESEPPAEIEISMADRIPTEEGKVLTSANDATIPVSPGSSASLPGELGESRKPPMPADSEAEAPTEGLGRPENTVLPGAPEPLLKGPRPPQPREGQASTSQSTPERSTFFAHHEAPTGSNKIPSESERPPASQHMTDHSASFRDRASPSAADVSASFQARPGHTPADASAGFSARPDASSSMLASPDVSSSFQARPETSGSFDAQSDMSGAFTPAPEKKEGGTGSRTGFRGLKEIRERYDAWVATEQGRKKSNLVVVTVLGFIFIGLLIWTLFMLPD